MKRFSFRAFFVVLLIVASISAQVFVSEKSMSQSNKAELEHQIDEDSLDTPHIQLDIEILKTLIEQGKNHLPVISNSPEFE